MSRGDFGYGSTVREYRDSPTTVREYRDEPGVFGAGYQQREGSSSFSMLVDEISSNIFTVNNNATTLERAMKQIGSSSDSAQLRDRVHATEQSTNDTISSTARALKQLAGVCTRDNNRQQKLQYQRLTNEFKEAAQRYNNLQKKVAAKVKSCVALSSPQQQQQQQGSDLINWGDGMDDEDRLIEEAERRAQMQAQQDTVETDVAMLLEREDRIRELESDILDINEIFRDLGTLVHEQGEVIDTIEANVEQAHDHVEAGEQELVKAARYQRKARKKMCILVVVLLIVALIIALIIYLSIKK